MSKDHLERRMYRKSPGRQYGYDYDPLKSKDGAGQSSHRSQSGLTASKAGTVLSQRPDPRRTRQLLRQSIINSKRSSEHEGQAHTQGTEQSADLYDWQDMPVQESPRAGHYESPAARSGRAHPVRHSVRPQPARYTPETEETYERYEYHEGPSRPTGAFPTVQRSFSRTGRLAHSLPAQEYPAYEDEGYLEDYVDAYQPPREVARRASRTAALQLGNDYDPRATRRLPPEELLPSEELEEPLPSNRIYPEEEAEYDYEYEFEEDRTNVKRARKRLTRRGLLFGAGAAAIAGVGFAAIEAAPKLPQAAGSLGGTVEQQVQDAFNRGVQQGADQVRTEFVSALESLEGFTLEGAVTAARLTRVAYDVFVSPVVTFGSVLTGDFLSGMLGAFKKAREWLAGVYQDNATLIAIQKVLESWVNQVQTMPKKLDSITQADLDGAQSYLRALQRKIADEKNKLPQSTPTPVATRANSTSNQTGANH